MRIPITTFATGLIFGAGLAISDMINPARVLAFLDIAGEWDPSLAFVMGGALIPAAIGFAISRKMRKPLFDTRFYIPENRIMDTRLIMGGALFGIGWGLVGLCPGPALAGLVLGKWEIWLFVLSMLAGMQLHRVATSRPLTRNSAASGQPTA
jgi:uncharacterized protein